MPRPNIEALAKQIREGSQPPKVDYWMLQANIFMQQIQEKIKDNIGKLSTLPAEERKLLNEIMTRDRATISEKDIEDYQALLKLTENHELDAGLRQAISQAMFEVPDVAGDAFKVLVALDTASPTGESTLAKHKRLLKTYTTPSPTSSLMTNPNGNKDRMFSVSGVDYDPMGAGRIPYGYEFHDGGHDGRQIPISTGTPVKHSGGSAFGVHLVGTANIGKNASVHGSFHSYLEGVCSGGKEDAPSYGSGVVGKEEYPQEDGDLDYVYINLQKHDADITGSGKRERIAESVRSDALYREINSYGKAACLTLPADNKFFWQGFDRHTATGDGSRATSDSLLDQIVKSIADKKNDFIIPDKVLKKMYAAKGMEIPDNLRDTKALKELIKDSFTDAVKGITGSDELGNSLDSETRSAVMLHFVKATFTDQILNATNPKRFNITCKDAIDRAGTHNLWLQIHRKLNAEPSQTVERAEVERFLDGLAMAYKHRPANEHRDAFINAMGKFYANLDETQKDKFTDEGKPWDVGKWLDINCRTKPTIPITKPANIEIQEQKPKGLWNSIKKFFGASYKATGVIEVDGKRLDVEFKSDSKEMFLTGEGGTGFTHTAVLDQGLRSSLRSLQSAEMTVPGSSAAMPDATVASPPSGPLSNRGSRVEHLAAPPTGPTPTIPNPSSVEAGPSAVEEQPTARSELGSRMSILASAPSSLSARASSPIAYDMKAKCKGSDQNGGLRNIASRCSAPAQKERASGPAKSAPAGPRRTQ